jgi:serine/threonine-protein kinase
VPAHSADRNLLFGILALQMDFVSRDALVAAMNAWVLDKARPIGEILRDQGGLSAERLALLNALVAEHVKQHNDDPQKSLAAVNAMGTTRHDLRGIADADVQASLVHASSARTDTDPGATRAEGAAALPSSGSRYRILRPHAKGGLGEVSVAHDEELDREVALKEMQPCHAGQPAHLSRFLLEAKVTGGLEHPGIVPVYGLGTYADGRPYYAMRFVRGDNLKDAIARFHKERVGLAPGERTLRLRQLLGCFLDVCHAIEYAHSRGVLHRDLKPGNILVGKYGETLVVDWGLAKVLDRADVETTEGVLRNPIGGDSALTQAGTCLGTPAFMSPEQAAGRLDQMGPRSDVYSLGATLYCVLTGRPPFTEPDVAEVLKQVQGGDFPRPWALDRSIAPALEAVCCKAMALTPQGRYASPHALAADLEKWLADEPVSAYREPWPARLARWRRHHSTLVAAAAALLVAAVGALSVGATLLGRANVQIEREREEARVQRDLARANFRTARQAVDDYLTTVSQNQLLQSPLPGLQPLRKELLHLALNYYQDFVTEHQDDPELRKDLGAAYLRLGLIVAEVESAEKALALDERGVGLLEDLAGADAGDVGLTRLLANGHTQLGSHLMRGGRDAEALTHLERAVALHGQLLRADAGDQAAAYDLARALNTLGALHASRLRSADGLKAYQEAAALLERLNQQAESPERLRALSQTYTNIGTVYIHNVGPSAKAIPVLQSALGIQDRLAKQGVADPENQRILSLIHYNLGLALGNNGREEEAGRHFDEAIAVGEKLARENPTVAGYQATLAESYRVAGRFHRRHRRSKEALRALQSAVTITDKLAREHKGDTDYQQALGLALNSLGILYTETGAPAEAEQTFRRALDVMAPLARDNPRNNRLTFYESFIRGNLGGLCRKQGRNVEAAQSYEKARGTLGRLVADNPKDYYIWDDFAGLSVALAEVDLTLGKVVEGRSLLRDAHEHLANAPQDGVSPSWRRARLHAQLARLAGFGKESLTPEEEKARGEHLDRAMTYLRRAIDGGFDELQEVKTDNTLDPLRGRPDFQELLGALESQGRPK